MKSSNSAVVLHSFVFDFLSVFSVKENHLTAFSKCLLRMDNKTINSVRTIRREALQMRKVVIV